MTRYWFLRDSLYQKRKELAPAADPTVRVIRVHRARALIGLSISWLDGTGPDHDLGLKYARQAQELYQKAQDQWGEGAAFRCMGLHYNAIGLQHMRKGDARNRELFHQAGLRAYASALHLYERLGDTYGIGSVYYCRSFMDSGGNTSPSWLIAQVNDAKRALECFMSVGVRRAEADASDILRNTAAILPLNIETAAVIRIAEAECRRQIALAHERREKSRALEAWRHLSEFALKRGKDPYLRECLFQTSDAEFALNGMSPTRYVKLAGAILAQPGTPPPPWRDYENSRQLKSVGQERGNQLFAQGKRLTLGEAVRFAISPE
jgi:hypothetical protein